MRRVLAALVLAILTAMPVASFAAPARVPPIGQLGAAVPSALAKGPRRDSTGDEVRMHVQLRPAPAHVGEQVSYHAHVLVPRGTGVQFGAPEDGGDLTWGPRTAGRARAADNSDKGGNVRTPTDSVWVELPMQAFRSGYVDVPGLTLKLDPFPGTTRMGVTRLPIGHLLVIPSITAADSDAHLRPVRGPLGAPWWERIVWRVVALVALALAAILLAIVYARRGKPRAKPAASTIAPRAPRLDPAAEALQALARLRAERLPEQARYGDHALALTRILRRFLEATVGTPMPGDTSPELLVRLRASRLAPADVERLEGLLGFWDRVKFAQAPMGADEAHRCEDAVEALVRRRGEAEARREAIATPGGAA